MPAALMNRPPSSSAAQPAAATPARSLRPTACPTRTAAAELIPSGTMNVVEITWTAIPCAASDTSSSFAAITVTMPKTAPSNAICPAAGHPSAISRRMRARSGARTSGTSSLPDLRSCHTTRDQQRQPYTRARSKWTSPSPASPIGGTPQLPYISSQLPAS